MAKNNKPVSNVYDSSDEGQSDLEKKFNDTSIDSNKINYIKQLHQGARSTSYPFSYILTDISNRLLLSNEITLKYDKIKDPLEFKIGTLKERKFAYENSIIGIKSLNSDIEKHTHYIKNLRELNKLITEKYQNKQITAGVNNEIKTKIESFITEQQQEHHTAENTRKEWIEMNKDRYKLEDNHNFSDVIVEEASNIHESIIKVEEKLKEIKELKREKDILNKELKGAFPFSIKKLSQSFIQDYQNKVDSNDNADEIVKKLTKLRDQLSIAQSQISSINDYYYADKICKLFNVDCTKKIKGTGYIAKTLQSLSNKLGSVIGRAPTAKDIEEYIRLNEEKLSKEQEFSTLKSLGNQKDIIKYIKNRVNDYLVKNANKISQILEETDIYARDYDYLQELNEQDFLVQVRAYRKLHRDLEKFLLLSGDEGTINVPPGNTTIKIFSSGSATLKHGQFGAYKGTEEIHSETLRNYKSYITTGADIKEKEKEFKSWSQDEAIRNTSALLTNAMFFELAEHEFDSVRILASNKKYKFENISEQMPMAMEGAVSGSVYLEMKFDKILTGKLPYDYRKDGDDANGKVLDARNNNILFDWLSYKMDIKVVLCAINMCKNLCFDVIIGNTTWKIESISGTGFKNKDQLTLKNEEGYEIILQKGKSLKENIEKYVKYNVLNKLLAIEKGNISLVKEATLGKYYLTEENGQYKLIDQYEELLSFTAKIEKKIIVIDKIEFCKSTIDNLTKNFCLTEISTFPSGVFNELIKEWYDIELPYLKSEEQGLIKLKLKAEAEPKDPDIDKKDDEQKAVLVVETNQDDTYITKDLEDLHEVDRKDCAAYTNIALNEHESHPAILGCIEVEIAA